MEIREAFPRKRVPSGIPMEQLVHTGPAPRGSSDDGPLRTTTRFVLPHVSCPAKPIRLPLRPRHWTFHGWAVSGLV